MSLSILEKESFFLFFRFEVPQVLLGDLGGCCSLATVLSRFGERAQAQG